MLSLRVLQESGSFNELCSNENKIFTDSNQFKSNRADSIELSMLIINKGNSPTSHP